MILREEPEIGAQIFSETYLTILKNAARQNFSLEQSIQAAILRFINLDPKNLDLLAQKTRISAEKIKEMVGIKAATD